MKLYLDADVFLALIKEKDRFKQKAEQFLTSRKKEELVTSTITCLEVWFYLYKYNLQSHAWNAIEAIEKLCTIQSCNQNDLKSAILLAQKHRLSPADAIHATLAMNCDNIVSTDKAFDKVSNLKRIDFGA